MTLQVGARTITLIGTAHLSRASVVEVERQIEAIKPQRLCVELDEARYRLMTEGHSWKHLDIVQVLRKRQGFLLLFNLLLSAYQQRMGVDIGIKPGAEMRAAIEMAKQLHIPYSLCDRNIQTTMRRAWRKSRWWSKNKLLATMIAASFSRQKISDSDIEALKQHTVINGMMEELSDFLPSIKHVLIDERDRYIATRIFQQPEERIVAVVGLGHMRGIADCLERLEHGRLEPSLKEIDSVPPKGAIGRTLPWVIPVVVFALIVLGFVRSGWDGGMQTLLRWVLVNGSLSAIGAIVALAHPLTILASFVAAPITSMNPTIGVGFVTGLLEATLRRPRVADFETLSHDLLSLRGFFRNRLTHVLLVFFLSSVGSAIATFIALPMLFP